LCQTYVAGIIFTRQVIMASQWQIKPAFARRRRNFLFVVYPRTWNAKEAA
jgi:hypothetical protein